MQSTTLNGTRDGIIRALSAPRQMVTMSRDDAKQLNDFIRHCREEAKHGFPPSENILGFAERIIRTALERTR